MYISFVDAEIGREHYRDLIREAEHERLVRLALEAQPARVPAARRFANWATRLALRWACRLALANTLSVCSRI